MSLAPIAIAEDTEAAHAPSDRYRADIDGLRGLAVFGVVAFHAWPAYFSGGFVGVDVFFVISGFLISSLVLGAVADGRFTLAGFYSRRARRLFPALVAVLTAALCAGWYLLPGTSFASLGMHTAAASAFIANVAFWRESGYFDVAADAKPLLHLWSLGVEEQFYLTWPLLLVVAYRRRINLVAMTVGLGLLSFALNVATVRIDAAAAFYLPHGRAWQLLAGSLLALLIPADTSEPDRRVSATRRRVVTGACGAAGVLLIGAGVFAIGETTTFPGWWALLPVSGACLVIAAGPEGWVNRQVLSQRWLVGLGLVSYPLYLWHWPVLSFARLSGQTEPSPGLLAGLIAIALALAWATYRFVERPVRFGRYGRSATAVIGLVGCSAAVGVAGFTAANGRLQARHDRRFGFISANAYDYRSGYRGGTCQLSTKQTSEDFASTCVDRDFGGSGRRDILIWGDSHAAHLYPGLRRRADSEQIALAQYTADGCPPLEQESSDFCRGINDFVQRRLADLDPDVILLAADWTPSRIDRLPGTIALIQRETDARIVVVGPVPEWDPSLPQALVAFGQSHPLEPVPERLRDGVKGARFEIDRAMRQLLSASAAIYVSPLEALCSGDGCLAVLSNRVTTWDDAHLTDVGSDVVAAAILRRVIR